MSELLQIPRPDGESCPIYVSEPAAPGAPGLVVIQEWWGLNDQIKRTADRFAQAGYRAVVPDLFRGRLASDADEASHLMNGLNFLEATDQDVAACVSYLRRDAKRCGVTGFCMGGALTIFSALRVSGVDAGACFYGVPPREFADPSQMKVPMILHFAQKDDWCTPAVVDALEKDLSKSSSKYSLYRYDAQHAFMNQARPEVYDEACAKLAWERTLKFFERTLKG